MIKILPFLMILIGQTHEGIDFKANKDVVSSKESVCFTIINKSEETVQLPSPHPWYIVDKEGKIIYSPMSIQVIVDLKPNTIKQWCWDQKDGSEVYVKPGQYEVKTHIYISKKKYEMRVEFEIKGE